MATAIKSCATEEVVPIARLRFFAALRLLRYGA
ncbi:MAG: hypothetical protein JWS10_4193 [Cypionkella sp.]|nr:hypothetical protein [Cypionkella sp.]